MVYGLWSLVCGLWFLVCGLWFRVFIPVFHGPDKTGHSSTASIDVYIFKYIIPSLKHLYPLPHLWEIRLFRSRRVHIHLSRRVKYNYMVFPMDHSGCPFWDKGRPSCQGRD